MTIEEIRTFDPIGQKIDRQSRRDVLLPAKELPSCKSASPLFNLRLSGRRPDHLLGRSPRHRRYLCRPQKDARRPIALSSIRSKNCSSSSSRRSISSARRNRSRTLGEVRKSGERSKNLRQFRSNSCNISLRPIGSFTRSERSNRSKRRFRPAV